MKNTTVFDCMKTRPSTNSGLKTHCAELTEKRSMRVTE